MYNNKRLITSFPDIIQPPIKQNTWKWLRAAMLKATRYCSTQDTFREEMLEIEWELQFYKIPNTVFNLAYDEILQDF
ncbi:unnamed protein product, partial [Rotaria sp. Silwood2]